VGIALLIQQYKIENAKIVKSILGLTELIICKIFIKKSIIFDRGMILLPATKSNYDF